MKNSKLIPLLLSAGASVLMACAAWSQAPAIPEQFLEKIQALQKARTENELRLHTYQWIETTTVTVNGKSQSPRQSICRYTSYGTVSKTPLEPPPAGPAPKGGPLMRHMEEKKIEETQESLAEVRNLVARYLPLGPGALQQAFQTNRIDFEHNDDHGNSIVISDFAKQGDKLILDLNLEPPELRSVRVNSYLNSPSDVLTADVQFAVLPDGTRYPGITTINAPGRQISITTVQSSFSKTVQ